MIKIIKGDFMQLLDKLCLIMLTSIIYISDQPNIFNIIFILIMIALSCLNSYFENDKLRYMNLGIYTIISFFYHDFLYFLPFLLYDSVFKKEQSFYFLFFIVFIYHNDKIDILNVFTILFLIALSILLAYKTRKNEELLEKNKKIKDDSEELKILQEQKQRELLDRQDYEIQLAKSEERNRIAREIHDSVGHNLSSSLLQIGAMIAINKDEAFIEPLQNMKTTLSDGMNSIRNSVHDLHQDTLHLESEMNKIIDRFKFCDIHFNYRASNLMDLKLKYCFINILKEALNNVMKHSNATLVNVSLIETNKYYQFIIQDNGKCGIIKEGLGLKSMQERILNYNGICNFSSENGFKIFITIPKED